ncbi:MAG: exodeoxyribonuclease III [Candidatus Hodarchaeota archaeon]
MELLSWNVNGLRACLKKGFIEWVRQRSPDILCIQETKAQPNQISFSLELPDYQTYWKSAQKKGYSGVAVLTKRKPLSISTELGKAEFDREGRFLQLELEDFYLINLYFPNAQRELKRIDFKLRFNEFFLSYIEKIRKKKHLIFCGDFNVAHKEIDLKNPKENQNNAGFSPKEREWFTKLIQHGYIDTFRKFHPNVEGEYTWWTYRYNARKRNIGWRIDYFIINQEFQNRLESAFILKDVIGSDHAPVGITIKE